MDLWFMWMCMLEFVYTCHIFPNHGWPYNDVWLCATVDITAGHTFYLYSFYSSYACQAKPKIGTLLPLCKVDYLYYWLSFTLRSIPAANAWCQNDIMLRECDSCLHTKHRQSIKPLPLFEWANMLFGLQTVPVWLHSCFSCWLKLGIWWHDMCFHM